MTHTKPDNGGRSLTTSSGLADLEHAVTDPPLWLTEAMSVPREEGYVDVDGCQIHYFRWGDASKPGIVMLHGFIAHARCFAFIAPYLAADYHVVAYDMSGMGDSGRRDAYPQQGRVDELMSVCQQTGLFDDDRKPTIVAHSYGGKVGVGAVHERPDKFTGLVICDLMIIRPSVLEANAERFSPPGGQNRNRVNRVYPDFAAAKQRFVLSPPQAVEQPELYDFMAYHSLKQVEGGWGWKFDPVVFNREPGFENRWARTGETVVKAPGRKVIIYGQESVLFTPDSLDYVQELVAEFDMPDIPVIAIPNARHHLMLDQPMALVSALRTVLALWR